MRLRLAIYACILAAGLTTLVYLLITRTPLILDVIRDRNALYREVHGDHIENAYSLKVINLDEKPHIYQLQVTGMTGLEIAAPSALIRVPPGMVNTVSARLQAPSELATGVHPITLTLAATDDPHIAVHEKTRFIGPHS